MPDHSSPGQYPGQVPVEGGAASSSAWPAPREPRTRDECSPRSDRTARARRRRAAQASRHHLVRLGLLLRPAMVHLPLDVSRGSSITFSMESTPPVSQRERGFRSPCLPLISLHPHGHPLIMPSARLVHHRAQLVHAAQRGVGPAAPPGRRPYDHVLEVVIEKLVEEARKRRIASSGTISALPSSSFTMYGMRAPSEAGVHAKLGDGGRRLVPLDLDACPPGGSCCHSLQISSAARGSPAARRVRCVCVAPF